MLVGNKLATYLCEDKFMAIGEYILIASDIYYVVVFIHLYRADNRSTDMVGGGELSC